MKKFSRPLSVSVAACAALGLAACHPPHEQDSDLKIDTAETFVQPTATRGDHSHGAHSTHSAHSDSATGSDVYGSTTATPSFPAETIVVTETAVVTEVVLVDADDDDLADALEPRQPSTAR